MTIEIIKKEIAKAEEFKPPIKVFYLATSADTDAKLQKEVRLFTQKRVQSDRFSIGIWFWSITSYGGQNCHVME